MAVQESYTQVAPDSTGDKIRTIAKEVVQPDLSTATVEMQTVTVADEAGNIITVAKDGTDITTPTAMPAGGVGIRGWLSAIWTKLNGTIGVSGTVGTKTALTPAAPSAVSVGVTTTVVLAADATRKGCYLTNTSTGYISLGFGANAVLYSGITLNPGGGAFWLDEYNFVTGAINAISSVAASNLGIQVYT